MIIQLAWLTIYKANLAAVCVCVACTVDSVLLSDAWLGAREEDLSALS